MCLQVLLFCFIAAVQGKSTLEFNYQEIIQVLCKENKDRQCQSTTKVPFVLMLKKGLIINHVERWI